MCFLSPLVWWEKVINVLQSKFNPEAAISKLLTVYLFWHPFISFLFHTPERLFLLYHYPKLTTLSDSSTIFSISSIVETGQISLSSVPLIFKQVPHARIIPLFFRNFLIVPSKKGNLSFLIFSASTPLPSKNIFTEWLLAKASFPNLKQFHTVSASFVLRITPIFIVDSFLYQAL